MSTTDHLPLRSGSDGIADGDPFVPTVLFVDDESDVLDGLRVSLRRERRDFRFLFANSADEAIAILQGEPVDMVVSDMRMPDRNGADLLEEVRFRFPDVIRYVLSGQAEDRLVRRSVAVTHRWLHKPCDHETLIGALNEATGYRVGIDDAAIRRAIGSVDALSSHPETYRALIGTLGRAQATVDEVVGLVAADPAMTAKLLQWANSVYAHGDAIYDVRQAVERIGVDALAQLALADDVVRSGTSSEVIPGFGIDLFHRYAREVAKVAAGLTDGSHADLVAAAGLLSGAGLLFEVAHLRKRLTDAYRQALADGRRLVTVEKELFGWSHPELVGHLLALWGLPGELVAVVAASHDHPDPSAELPLAPLEAVQAARLLVQRTGLSRAIGSPHLDPVDDELATALERWSRRLDVEAGR